MPTSLISGHTLFFGLLCWLFPFLGAFPIVPLKEKRPLVFKCLMGVILAASTAILCRSYFIDAHIVSGMDGLWVGALWACMCVIIDLPVFLLGFKMKPTTYLSEIGVAYLIIPLMTWQSASLVGAVLGRS
jgi:hypothetical protein